MKNFEKLLLIITEIFHFCGLNTSILGVMKRHFLAGKTFFLDRVKIKRNKRIKRPQRPKIFVVAAGGWWLEKVRETSMRILVVLW